MPLLDDAFDAAALRRFKGFIFDCDGVLIDSFVANTVYYNKYRTHFGLPPMSPEDEHYTHIQNVYDSLRRIVPAELYEEALAYRSQIDYRDMLPFLTREPGIRRLLAWLKAASFRLGVDTNRMDTVHLVFKAVDLEGYFQPVMTVANTRAPKPDPDGVEQILAAWGLGADEVAFLGDSSVDEQTARNAGVAFWAFKNMDLDADLSIPDFATLARALSRAWPKLPAAPIGA
jgi:phosphoglycolate phosphatase-like HAD superfamily hydrolase